MSVSGPEIITPDPKPVTDPEPNKAIANFATWAAALAYQWISTGHFNLSQEGITTGIGLLSTALVYFVSNWRKRNAAVRGKARPYGRG